MSDHDDLVERFSTPRIDMTPEVRQRVEATSAWVQDLTAAGRIAAPDPLADDDTAPGLDTTNGYQLFGTGRPVA
jgi:hypothetical protein